MALTPAQIDALPTYTDAQLLKLYRYALVQIAEGKSISINGRNLTRADEQFIRDMIDWLEDRAANTDADAAGGGNVLVQFGEEQ